MPGCSALAIVDEGAGGAQHGVAAGIGEIAEQLRVDCPARRAVGRRQAERQMREIGVAVDQLRDRWLEIGAVAALDLAAAKVDLDRLHGLGQRIAGTIGPIVVACADDGSKLRQERRVGGRVRDQFLVEQRDDQDMAEMLAHVDHHSAQGRRRGEVILRLHTR